MANEKSDRQKSNLNFISGNHQLKIDKNFKIYLSVLLLIIIYSSLFIFWELLTQYDTALFLEICRNRIPAIESFFVLWTNVGTFLFTFLIIVFLWLKGEKNPAIYLAFGLVLDVILINTLKTMIHRPRPYEVLFVMPLELGDNFGSLPSGHTSRAFLSATILSKFYSKYMIVFFVIAATIGFSRVYIGTHYPLDVIVGAITGSLLGILMIDLLDRLEVGKRL
jgi:membrane-associated phospholipid phosphatase